MGGLETVFGAGVYGCMYGAVPDNYIIGVAVKCWEKCQERKDDYRQGLAGQMLLFQNCCEKEGPLAPLLHVLSLGTELVPCGHPAGTSTKRSMRLFG